MTNAAAIADREQQSLRAEIHSVRVALAEVAPAMEACRRDHTGEDLAWFQLALSELLGVANELCVVLPEADRFRLEPLRVSALQALTDMGKVMDADARMILPKPACGRVHIPEEAFRVWYGPAALLEKAVSSIYDREVEAAKPALSSATLQRAWDASCEARRAFWRFHGVTCPCSGCASNARAAARPPVSKSLPAHVHAGRGLGSVSAPTLASALVLAEARVRSLGRDLRNEAEGWSAASAENVFRVSRAALTGAGLSLSVKSSKFAPVNETKGLWALEAVFLLEHVSGESRTIEKQWPTVLAGDRPIEQLAAGASTSALRYLLRDLLLLDQAGEEDADGKRPSIPDGAARARKIRARIALYPEHIRLSLEDGLARALGDERALESYEEWAELHEPKHQTAVVAPTSTAGAGSPPAPSPAGIAPTTAPAAAETLAAGAASTPSEASSGTVAGERPQFRNEETVRASEDSPAASTSTPSSEEGGGVGTPPVDAPRSVTSPAPQESGPSSPGSPREIPAVSLEGAHAHNDSRAASAADGAPGAPAGSEGPVSGKADEAGGALTDSPASPTAGPSPSNVNAKLSEADVCMRLGNDSDVSGDKRAKKTGWAELICGWPSGDLLGPTGSEIVHRAMERHPHELVEKLFDAAGGQRKKDGKKRTSLLTGSQIRSIVAGLPVATSPRDRATKDDEAAPLVADAVNSLPTPPNADTGF